MSRMVVRGLAFDELGAVVIDYVDGDTDLLENGLLRNHSLQIPPTDEFDELLQDLEQACQKALGIALSSFDKTAPLVLEDDEDDEGPGPYDNPADGGQA